jgi:DNA-binding NarL/FixJ family response regulator
MNQKETTMSATLMCHEAPLKILAVDDHPLTREALGQVLAQVAPRVEMLEADTLAAACARLAADPGIRLVVLDPSLPDADGVDTVKSIMEASPKALVLVLAGRDDPATARAALEAGAHGFISRRVPTRVLVEALRLVLAGGVYIPPEALRADAAPTRTRTVPPANPDASAAASQKPLGLTPRQLDVLAHLVQGKPNKLICRALDLREGTIKTHIAAIYRALGVVNRTEAVYAVSKLGVALPVEAPRPSAPAAREPVRPHVASAPVHAVPSRPAAIGTGWLAAVRQLQFA